VRLPRRHDRAETLCRLVSESGYQVKRESLAFVVLWKKQEREASLKK
jgi:hypothetical protein